MYRVRARVRSFGRHSPGYDSRRQERNVRCREGIGLNLELFKVLALLVFECESSCTD
jgi:hypothetical protein